MSSSTAKPLLIGCGLPAFGRITAEQVPEAIPTLLRELETELNGFEERLQSTTQLDWEGVMEPLQRIAERLRWSWGIVGHLMGVCNSDRLRQAHGAQQPAVVAFSNRMAQSKPIFHALRQLEASQASGRLALDACQQRILSAELRGMGLRGVGLAAIPRRQFNSNAQRLAECATTFANHLLDATAAWQLWLRDEDDMAGLPGSLRQLLAQAAARDGEPEASASSGPWKLGLDLPSYGPFLKYSQRRDLREQAYRGFVSRASLGDCSNWPLIEEILRLRREQAQLLGYANWADVSLAEKMADSLNGVTSLLEELRVASYPAAQRELADLRDCARRHGAAEADDLQPWDLPYWAEILRRERFALDGEALRPWFPLPRVLEGLFALCNRLFGISIEAADGEAEVWEPSVRYFTIREGKGHPNAGQAIASFFLDPYSRPGSKRGGAWMDVCLTRSRSADGTPVLPVAYLVCNQSPPLADTPSLMTFDEVGTLFHEFGHGLQHMLTTIERPEAAGINNVEWDAVELPSQFMENWCYDRPALMGLARHWQTGDSLPGAEYRKLLAARTFMSGSAMLRQLHFALTDLELHANWSTHSGESPEQVRRRIAADTTVMAPITEDAFLCGFSHIFAGGYGAGYYSYLWAEVLSADAFAAFEEAGLCDEAAVQATGRRFRETVLSLGGSQHPGMVFQAFRGRGPSPEALLRHSGLAAGRQ